MKKLITLFFFFFSFFFFFFLVSNTLGLDQLKNRQWAIFKTSAIKGIGMLLQQGKQKETKLQSKQTQTTNKKTNHKQTKQKKTNKNT